MKNIFRLVPLQAGLLAVVFCLFTTANHLQAQWVQTNGPDGGITIELFAVCGANLFAANPDAMFRSSDNGESWTAMNAGLSVRTFTVIDSIVFAGTYYNGLFRSSDNGASWTAVNTGLTDTLVSALAVMGKNLFAGTGSGKVFRSSDNGTTWTEVSTGLKQYQVTALVVKGTDLFAATWGGGVFRSTNNGTSWTAVNNGLMQMEICALAVSGANLLVSTEFPGIFLSSDNGASWIEVNSGLTQRVFAFAVINANLFAATGDGVFLSTDNGISWTVAGLMHNCVLALAVMGTNLFAGTNGLGVFRSSDNGTSWIAVNTGFPPCTDVYNLCGNDMILFADDFFSRNKGSTWVPVDSSLMNPHVTAFAVNGPYFFAGTSGGGVYRSGDNGASWTAVNNGLMNPYVHSIVVNDTFLFVGTSGGVFRSSDSGISWAPAGLTNNLISFLAVSNSNLFALSPYDDGFKYSFFRSGDNGASWITLNSPLVFEDNNTFITALTVIDTSIFVPTAGAFASSDIGILRSTDNGESWTSLPIYDVSALIAIGTSLFAGAGGVFRSSDNGVSWTAVNEGLRSPYVYSLVVGGTDLYAGVYHGGVWRRPLSEMITTVSRSAGSSDLLTQFNLEQNYPNPFNPSTTIEFALPKYAFVTLKIYNLLGEEVATLVAEQRAAGIHKLNWDARGMASGVYLYRLEADSFRQSKKLILMR